MLKIKDKHEKRKQAEKKISEYFKLKEKKKFKKNQQRMTTIFLYLE